MFIAIVQNTPRWVWVLLAALIALGVSQSFPRRGTLRGAVVFPVTMVALSCYGVLSAFPFQPMAVAAWMSGVAATAIASIAVGAWSNIRWSDEERRLLVPGSWMPLMLMLGLFAIKFGVGVALVRRPELASGPIFAMPVALAYGAFSGVFFGRGLTMWRAARHGLRPGIAA